MTSIYQPTIRPTHIISNKISDTDEYVLDSYGKISPTITKTVQPTPFYKIKNSIGVDATQSASRRALQLQDESVRTQTIKLLDDIDTYLNDVISVAEISNRLPQIHLTEQEDNSVLIEWNFENFRIGFSIESQPSKSFYFIIREDNTSGLFKSETRYLDNTYDKILANIIKFVIKHS
jgi:hypothetical protein